MPKPLTKTQQEAQDRDRHRRQFLAMAAAARRAHEPWVEWIDAGCPEITRGEWLSTKPKSARGQQRALGDASA